MSIEMFEKTAKEIISTLKAVDKMLESLGCKHAAASEDFLVTKQAA